MIVVSCDHCGSTGPVWGTFIYTLGNMDACEEFHFCHDCVKGLRSVVAEMVKPEQNGRVFLFEDYNKEKKQAEIVAQINNWVHPAFTSE